MRLSPSIFNDLLRNMGQQCLWRVAQACPCRDPHSGAADPGCPVCGGRGTFWGPAKRAHTGLTSMKVAREWQSFGVWESGDVVLTVPSDSPLYAAGEHDQVVLTQSTEPYQNTLTRGAPDETLPAYLSAIEAISVIEDGAVVAKSTPRLADPFQGGTPLWPAVGGPAEGQQYSIRGRRHPTYFVFQQLPQDRAHHGGRALPRRIAARRLDLFQR